VLLGSLHDVDLRPILGLITCATLVVGAELDVTFPPEHSRALAAGISGARLEIVKGSGHGLVASSPNASWSCYAVPSRLILNGACHEADLHRAYHQSPFGKLMA